jgi:hypothetical protein
MYEGDDTFAEIRGEVRKLCEQFSGEYWRAHERENSYPQCPGSAPMAQN